MPPLSFQHKVAFANHLAIVLCLAKDAEGRDLFHYIWSDRKNLERLYLDYDKGTPLDFASYGEILYSGWGEPTAEERAMVRAKWGQAE